MKASALLQPRARRVLAATIGSIIMGLPACGSVKDDQSCASFVNPQLQSAYPSVVRVAFQLEECDGKQPLPGLELSDFKLLEDGATISSFESRAALVQDDRSFQQSVLLLLDLSGSVVSSLPEVKTAAKSLIDGLSSRPQVALYTFDGRAAPQLRADFTTDLPSIVSAIEDLVPEQVDTSTNLNGAVVNGVQILENRRLAVEGSGILYTGALALFTDGTDRAHRVPDAEALQAAKDSKVSVFAIGLGSEIDSSFLKGIGASGQVVLAPDLPHLSDAFAKVGRSISGLANSYYVLAYCSPSRANSHELSLSVVGHSGSWGAKFDAGGFVGGCTPEDFLSGVTP
jgi:uncharacterized protein YegL